METKIIINYIGLKWLYSKDKKILTNLNDKTNIINLSDYEIKEIEKGNINLKTPYFTNLNKKENC